MIFAQIYLYVLNGSKLWWKYDCKGELQPPSQMGKELPGVSEIP